MPNLLGSFLRHAETGRWLTHDGRLSFNAQNAYPLRTTLEAIELCRKLQLQGMELVLSFDNPAYDISVSVLLDEDQRS